MVARSVLCVSWLLRACQLSWATHLFFSQKDEIELVSLHCMNLVPFHFFEVCSQRPSPPKERILLTSNRRLLPPEDCAGRYFRVLEIIGILVAVCSCSEALPLLMLGLKGYNRTSFMVNSFPLLGVSMIFLKDLRDTAPPLHDFSDSFFILS